MAPTLPHLSTDQVAAFVELARQGQIRSTAGTLGITEQGVRNRLLTLEAQMGAQSSGYFSSLVREGIADGSLRRDVDPDLTMHAVINAVIGAQRRLASLGNKVEVEYGQPVDRLFRETIRIILLGLRPTHSNGGPKRSERPNTRKSKKRIS